jgi:lysozyme
MLPKSGRPRLARAEAEAIIARHGIDAPVVLIGIRGYYRETMGRPGANDRGIYDDAMIVVTPDHYATFNANTDPSRQKPGIASLVPGVHKYRKGKHGISRGPGYNALRPATPGEQLPVTRDGIREARPGVAINIHRGGITSTSSAGCQTIWPAQYAEFIALVYREMTKHDVATVPYILIEAE